MVEKKINLVTAQPKQEPFFLTPPVGGDRSEGGQNHGDRVDRQIKMIEVLTGAFDPFDLKR
jgi:hypothetical protein